MKARSWKLEKEGGRRKEGDQKNFTFTSFFLKRKKKREVSKKE
jgi:hypothetical protein